MIGQVKYSLFDTFLISIDNFIVYRKEYNKDTILS